MRRSPPAWRRSSAEEFALRVGAAQPREREVGNRVAAGPQVVDEALRVAHSSGP